MKYFFFALIINIFLILSASAQDIDILFLSNVSLFYDDDLHKADADVALSYFIA